MGRSSLEATKLWCSFMVRAELDFFREELFFLDFDDGEDFLAFFDVVDELFFLFLAEDALLDLLEELVALEDSELCAGKALVCRINPVKTAAVNRLKDIVDLSLTRCAVPSLYTFGCTFRFLSSGPVPVLIRSRGLYNAKVVPLQSLKS
jgi:hypothetical protein